MSNFARERQVAIACGKAAALLCQRVQRGMVTADTLTKKDRSPVTVADFGSQALVSRLLQQSFPDDPIVGEESAAELRKDEGAEIRDRMLKEVHEQVPDASSDQILDWIDRCSDEGGNKRFWTLDPIDGTKGFLRGEQYAVALALVINGEVQVATLTCPNLPLRWGNESEQGSLFVAVRGEGAHMMPILGETTETPIKASECTEFSPARIVESVEAAHGNHSAHDDIKDQLGIQGASVRLDSQAKYGVLSRGEAEIYLRMPTRADYREAIWDQAAGSLVIEEAGGKVTDAYGEPLDFTTGRRLQNNQGVIGSNGVLHDELIETVRKVMEAS